MDSLTTHDVEPVWKLIHHQQRVKPDFPVFIAGSFALFMYERIALKTKPLWIPNDCDIFVLAGSETAFAKYVSSFAAFLSRVCDDDMAFTLTTSTRYQYALGQDITFKEINLDGMDVKLSFIFNPACTEVHHVLNGFDIDVVRVNYDIKSRVFRVPVYIKWNILRSEAKVLRVFKWASNTPTEQEQRALTQTLERMRKYQQRGYRFLNIPRVVSLSAARPGPHDTSPADGSASDDGDSDSDKSHPAKRITPNKD